MKQMLPILLFMCLCSASNGQNVLLKDSTSPGAVGYYTYDASCRETKYATPYYEGVYTYYPDGKVYQLTNRVSYFGTSPFVYLNRFTYHYDDYGRTILVETERWNSNTSMFDPLQRDSMFYNSQGLVFRVASDIYYANSQTWTPNYVQLNYYNALTNQTDSTIKNDYFYNGGVKNYFTYYTGSRNYEILSQNFSTASGSPYGSSSHRQRVFEDSANYVKKDSVVGESPNTDTSYHVTAITVDTFYYNADNTLSEENHNVLLAVPPQKPSRSAKYYYYGTCSSVLPITVSRFSATRQNNNVAVKWQTAGEIGVASFSIQRSTDGVHFITIGEVAAAAGVAGKAYAFTDVNALFVSAPKLYYKLAETGKDGSLLYSNIVSLDIAAGKVLITALPNPATSMIKVYSSVTLNDAIINVSDMQGKTVYISKQNIPAGGIVPVTMSAFAKGIYIITVQSASYKDQVKIVKE